MEFDRWLAVLWTSALLFAAGCRGEFGTPAPIVDAGMCLSQAGAIRDVPPVHCHPLGVCDATLQPTYVALHQQCRTNDTARKAARESFLFQAKYWQGDHVFLYGLLQKSVARYVAVRAEAPQVIAQQRRLVQELRRKLLVYSIEAGRTEDAVVLYLSMREPPPTKQLLGDLATNGALHEVLLEHVLTFVRALPIADLRKELYKGIMPLLSRNGLKRTYAVLVYVVDAVGLFPEKNELLRYIGQPVREMVERLRGQMVRTQYDENAWIANNYPHYYTYFINELTTFATSVWEGMEKLRFYEFSSMLTNKLHRFVVLEAGMKLFEKHDHQHMRESDLLPTLAVEVDKLQVTVRQTGSQQKERMRMKHLQDRFGMGGWFTRRYRNYLVHAQHKGKFGTHNLELERIG
uniref:SG1-2 n=1 Tax=Anopheles dirus TaxID=7168 RepID=A0A182MZN0_9DIPT